MSLDNQEKKLTKLHIFNNGKDTYCGYFEPVYDGHMYCYDLALFYSEEKRCIKCQEKLEADI